MSRRLLVAAIATATAAGLYFATQLKLAYPAELGYTWGHALALNLAFYWVWAAAVPLVLFLARRLPIDRARWKRTLPAHLLLGAAVTVAQLVVAKLALLAFASHPTLAELGKSVRQNFHSSYPTYWVILLAAAAVRAASLEARLTELRLDALRGQLQPHFLFNVLNSISSLMYSDVQAADAMVTRLADLLRRTLRDDGRREIPLEEELDLVDRYLAIEQIRFEQRLRVRRDIAPSAARALVPPLLLQPLVENAVRHAVAPRPEGGTIAIAARADGGELRIEVADDGPGLLDAGEPGLGVGLANTRARLAELGGRLELSSARGLTVTLRLPWRT